jgi:hypothetical protein
MSAKITKYDEELVRQAQRFLRAAHENPETTAILERFGFDAKERERGRELTDNAARAFEWERAGKAYNFLAPTPERRAAEARDWYKENRRRHVRWCLKQAEERAGWTGEQPASRWSLGKKLTLGTVVAMANALSALSPAAWLEHRTTLARDLEAARGERPQGAPPPKDSSLVELSGWFERWRLQTTRVFRERPDLLAPFGLTAGKPPPRLRSRSAVQKFGEKAATSGDSPAPPPKTNGARSLPIV